MPTLGDLQTIGNDENVFAVAFDPTHLDLHGKPPLSQRFQISSSVSRRSVCGAMCVGWLDRKSTKVLTLFTICSPIEYGGTQRRAIFSRRSLGRERRPYRRDHRANV